MLSLRLPAQWSVFSGTGLQGLNSIAGRVAAVVLLIVCFYYASSLFWRAFYPEGFRLAVPTVSDKGVATKVTGARGRWEWFTDTSIVKRKVAPPSRLNAKLIGVIARGTESGKGLALIKYKGKENIYRVEDELTSGIILEEIAGTYVILQRDGKTETLEIERAIASIGGSKRNSNARKKASSQKLPEPPEVVADVKQFRKILREKPMQLLNMFSFEQVGEGNRSGFSLSAKREDGKQMLDSLGLKEGDVLMAVNGAPASQMPSNPKLWKAVLRANKIKLKVLRNGKESEVSIK